ncbi:hypothetical protein CCACVL1_03275 [Corchorus capsularis]|nr:hypothetical protein CCACVL1_03275 [Corchorus capsularis]
MEKIVWPLSSGSLRLASTDVRVNPIIWFNYFSNPMDVERCVNGTRRIGDIFRSQSMDYFKFNEMVWDKKFQVFPSFPKKRAQENNENSVDRRHKRMMKNRESAARSRAGKQVPVKADLPLLCCVLLSNGIRDSLKAERRMLESFIKSKVRKQLRH